MVSDNKIYNASPVAGGGNTALYVWKQYQPPCGPVTVSRNVADALKPGGSHSGYWNGGGCEPVTLLGNVFSEAAAAIFAGTPALLTPPEIPPQPKNCVANSPYSNNTSKARCGAAR